MLWYDNSQTSLDVKIQKAAAYFHKKYGRTPDLCLVHSNMLKDEKPRDEKITIRPYRPVLPGHIWIGIEDNR
jgi:hypothetical protein